MRVNMEKKENLNFYHLNNKKEAVRTTKKSLEAFTPARSNHANIVPPNKVPAVLMCCV